MTRPFFERIATVAIEKKSPIVLALDPRPPGNQRLPELAARTICAVEHHICAVKMNFHIILPLSASEILRINKLAHSFGLQSIADIKLNDIETTNAVAVDHLIKMGFDAVIANPFIGRDALASLGTKGTQGRCRHHCACIHEPSRGKGGLWARNTRARVIQNVF